MDQNLGYWQHQKLWRLCSNRSSHSLLVGRQNVTATLEDSLKVSYEPEHAHTIQPRNHGSWYLPKGAINLCPQKQLHMM